MNAHFFMCGMSYKKTGLSVNRYSKHLGCPASVSEVRPAHSVFPGLLQIPFSIIREVTAARGNKAITKN